jgi:hypothetical protein
MEFEKHVEKKGRGMSAYGIYQILIPTPESSPMSDRKRRGT